MARFLKAYYESPEYLKRKEQVQIAGITGGIKEFASQLAQWDISAKQFGLTAKQFESQLAEAREKRLFERKKYVREEFYKLVDMGIKRWGKDYEANPETSKNLIAWAGDEARRIGKELFGVDIGDVDLTSWVGALVSGGAFKPKLTEQFFDEIEKSGNREAVIKDYTENHHHPTNPDYWRQLGENVVTKKQEFGLKVKALKIQEENILDRKIATIRSILAKRPIDPLDRNIAEKLYPGYYDGVDITGERRKQLEGMLKSLERKRGYPEEPKPEPKLDLKSELKKINSKKAKKQFSPEERLAWMQKNYSDKEFKINWWKNIKIK